MYSEASGLTAPLCRSSCAQHAVLPGLRCLWARLCCGPDAGHSRPVHNWVARKHQAAQPADTDGELFMRISAEQGVRRKLCCGCANVQYAMTSEHGAVVSPKWSASTSVRREAVTEATRVMQHCPCSPVAYLSCTWGQGSSQHIFHSPLMAGKAQNAQSASLLPRSQERQCTSLTQRQLGAS